MSARSAEMLGLLYALLQALGLLAAGKAVMEARTAQGATAWAVALVAFPLLALPLFLVFGQSRFRDYVTARRADLAESRPAHERAQTALTQRELLTGTPFTMEVPFERLAKLPFFRLNFEITMAVLDRELAAHAREMLEDDFARSRRVCADDLHARSLAFRFAVRLARLLAPVL